MKIYFGYDKRQVIQALRYHFISRKEIRLMLILVNVFALVTITLYALKKITPMPFFVGSSLWIVLMISFWFILPYMVYRKAVTFKHEFSLDFQDDGFTPVSYTHLPALCHGKKPLTGLPFPYFLFEQVPQGKHFITILASVFGYQQELSLIHI